MSESAATPPPLECANRPQRRVVGAQLPMDGWMFGVVFLSYRRHTQQAAQQAAQGAHTEGGTHSKQHRAHTASSTGHTH
eukprot:363550-Chlamydomonas_euryale.AAC.9